MTVGPKHLKKAEATYEYKRKERKEKLGYGTENQGSGPKSNMDQPVRLPDCDSQIELGSAISLQPLTKLAPKKTVITKGYMGNQILTL